MWHRWTITLFALFACALSRASVPVTLHCEDFELWFEDGPIDYTFGTCETPDGPFYLARLDPWIEYPSRANVTLIGVLAPTASGPSAYSTSQPSYAPSSRRVYHVLSTVNVSPPPGASFAPTNERRRLCIPTESGKGCIPYNPTGHRNPFNIGATAGHASLGILSMILKYTDATYSYAYGGGELTESVWREETFSTTSKSVHEAFYEASYGRVSLSESKSAFVVIEMGKAVPVTCGEEACDRVESNVARGIAASMGYDREQYDLLEFFLPDPFPGAGYAGKANTCAWQLGQPPQRSEGQDCYSYLLEGTIATRAHEFGHNFGLKHLSGNNAEYGGGSIAIMAMGVGGFTGSSRVALTWLSNQNFDGTNGAVRIEQNQPVKRVQLRALSEPLDSAFDTYSAAIVPCPHCRAAGPAELGEETWASGGQVIISYRGHTGTAQYLPSQYQDTVQVALLKKQVWQNTNSGTEQYAVLRSGESYYVHYDGFGIVVCAIFASPKVGAAVAIAYSSSRDAALADARQECGFASPPPPPPPSPNPCASTDSTLDCDAVALSIHQSELASHGNALDWLIDPTWIRDGLGTLHAAAPAVIA